MTYNFDPEKWFADRLALLEAQKASGRLDEEAFLREVDALEARREAMEDRLDGTFQVGILDRHEPA